MEKHLILGYGSACTRFWCFLSATADERLPEDRSNANGIIFIHKRHRLSLQRKWHSFTILLEYNPFKMQWSTKICTSAACDFFLNYCLCKVRGEIIFVQITVDKLKHIYYDMRVGMYYVFGLDTGKPINQLTGTSLQQQIIAHKFTSVKYLVVFDFVSRV